MIKDQLIQKCTAGPAQLVSSQAPLFQTHVQCPAHSIFGILTTELILRGHSQNFPQAQGKLMKNLCRDFLGGSVVKADIMGWIPHTVQPDNLKTTTKTPLQPWHWKDQDNMVKYLVKNR